MTRLLEPPGLTSLHLGVISTDLGAGDGSVAGCDATGGKNGIFQYTARGTCTTTGLDPGATFISDIDGVTNYTRQPRGRVQLHRGARRNQGAASSTSSPPSRARSAPTAGRRRRRTRGSCGPRPSSSSWSSPTRTTAPRRRTRRCSTPPRTRRWNPPLGPPGNFRCNEFGHLCNGARPPRLPPSGNANDVVTLDGCVSAEDAGDADPGRDRRGADSDRSSGSPTSRSWSPRSPARPRPYTVRWVDRPGDNLGPRPHIAASCTGADASSAAPAVRISQLAQRLRRRTAWSCRPAPTTTRRRSTDRRAHERRAAVITPYDRRHGAGGRRPVMTRAPWREMT